MGEPITIVTGLPRSGTSMMMRMLEAGGVPPLTDGKRTADEDNPNGYYELEAVMRTKTDASWLDDAPGRAVKMICLLLPHLPADREYRVILMVRDLVEVVRSQTTMLERTHTPGVGLTTDQFIKVYGRHLRDTRELLADFRSVEIDYAGAVANPHEAAGKVNELLGWELDEQAMVAAVDPTLYHQRAEQGTAGSS